MGSADFARDAASRPLAHTRSLSSGAHSRDPLAIPPTGLGLLARVSLFRFEVFQTDPCPACRLLRACSIRRKNRGSFSSRYSNQSSSDSKPIRIPAGLPWRVMTISCVSASRGYRDRSSLISESGTSFTPALRIVRAMSRPPIWSRSPKPRRSFRLRRRIFAPRRREADIPACGCHAIV